MPTNWGPRWLQVIEAVDIVLLHWLSAHGACILQRQEMPGLSSSSSVCDLLTTGLVEQVCGWPLQWLRLIISAHNPDCNPPAARLVRYKVQPDGAVLSLASAKKSAPSAEWVRMNCS